MDRLFTPWRLEYLLSARSREGCIFCDALASDDDRGSLVLLRGRWNFVILNRYPFTNGHLMVVPNRHLARLSEATADERHELIDLTARCEAALHRSYRPDGLNLGINLGRTAGASVADHYHLHLVPRWGGDTNFMSVTGATRLIPEDLDQSYRRLAEALQEETDA